MSGSAWSGLWDPDREIASVGISSPRQSTAATTHSTERVRGRAQNLDARGSQARGGLRDGACAREARSSPIGSSRRADRATHWGPNIYTYTKAIGEQVIARSGLPFTIARPASCESSVAFPERGYNEGATTSAPLIYLIMKGQPQIVGRHVPLDLIPTDYVVAGMIMALCELLEGTAKPVYQLGASDLNPCTVQRFGEMVGLYKRKYYQRKGTGNRFSTRCRRADPPSSTARGSSSPGRPRSRASRARSHPHAQDRSCARRCECARIVSHRGKDRPDSGLLSPSPWPLRAARTPARHTRGSRG